MTMKRIIAASAALLMLCINTEARKVSGTVASGETKLSGVIVTDGKNFAQTNKKGQFKMEIDDGTGYLYVVSPSGYMAGLPSSRIKVDGDEKFMFNLSKSDADICWGNPELKENFEADMPGAQMHFCPVEGNYAFFAGKDIVIVLDDANEHIVWVKRLETLLPDAADVYVILPTAFRYSDTGRPLGTANLRESLGDRRVTFLSGSCSEDAPKGYKVFSVKSGRPEWYYKTVGKPKDYQLEVSGLGKSRRHPNSVVVDIWDWDPTWTTEWFEDGRSMGRMTPAGEGSRRFVATPSQYSKTVTVAVENPFGKRWVHDLDMSEYVDVQAHRGGAGLMPENTIEAMKHALDMGVNTLELDLHVSSDGQVVVSHDPYFHYRYAVRPDGSDVRKEDKREYLFKMPYGEIAKYDVGSRPSDVWPEKACIKAVKPLAGELIDFVENYTREMGYSPVRYNIEIKSVDAVGEGQNWPTYDAFVTACCKLLHSKYLGDRLVVQSFDHRALNYMHEKYPEFIVSYLVDSDENDFEKYMSKLTFTPQWLSPHHSIVDEELVEKCRGKGMRIVPWTVDKPEDIKRLIDLGVEAIISNYPDRVLMQTRGSN